MAPTQDQAKSAKEKQLSGGKSPKARIQRYLKSTEHLLREGAKNTLIFQGIKVSASMQSLLKELKAMQAPHCKLLSKKNQITPFDVDGQQSIEFLATKNDCALFAMGTHNKKRPNNLILGRTFDRQILDMAELGVLRFKSMKDYGGKVPKKRIGSKPLLLFVGDLWQHLPDYQQLQNLLIDFYRGDVVDKLILTGIDHIIVFTASDPSTAVPASSTPSGGTVPGSSRVLIHQRTFFCQLKKNPNGTSIPVPYLEPCGPDLDFVLRRTSWAQPDLYKAARAQPAQIKKSQKKAKKKNQSTNLFGETVGRLHLEKQNVDKLQGRKSKALRRAEKREHEEEQNAIEEELQKEEKAIRDEFQKTYGFDQNDID